MTICTLNNYLLTALADFCAGEGAVRPVLKEVMLEIMPEAVRLVATDTYAMVVMHLPSGEGHGVTVECEEPLAVTVPVCALKGLLKERKRPQTRIAIDPDTLTATVSNAAGMQTTVPCRAGEEFVPYRAVLPKSDAYAREAITLDADFLARFGRLARALGVKPQVTLELHEGHGPVAVHLRHVDYCYGLIMPVIAQRTLGVPAWLQETEAAVPLAA